jgi:hypothetical protein
MAADLGIEKIKQLQSKVSWRHPGYRFAFAILILFAAVLSILAFNFAPSRLVGIKIGKPSPTTVKASRDIRIIDHEKTKELREKAVAAVQKVYKPDWSAEGAVVSKVKNFFAAVSKVEADQNLSDESKLAFLTNKFKTKISREALQTSLELSQPDRQLLESKIIDRLGKFYTQRITSETLADKKEEWAGIAAGLTSNSKVNQLAVEVGNAYLQPNYEYDPEATAKLKREAAAEIQPEVISKLKGETVVREGEIVTAQQVKILKELGLLGRNTDYARLAGLSFVVFSVIAALGIYLYSYHRKISENMRLLAVLIIIMLAILLIAKFIVPFFSPYLVPIAAAGMLTTLLFGVEMAVVLVVTVGLLTGVIVGQDFQFLAVALLGSLFAIFAVSHVRHRTDLAIAGFWVTASFGLLAAATSLLTQPEPVEVFKNLGWGLIGALAATVLTIGSLPFLEKLFGITTDIRLLELSYANQPLLRELMMKAPGTYNHSIMTGNLAESAAEEVGANPLLARVGGYYHDVGKMKRPLFFVENQIGGENPHDHTNPNLSCLIITSHVKEGIEIAKKYRLPKEIIDIIQQHHGTSVVSYFYQRAKENKVKEEVCEADFRYTGARPKTREAALVMLADSVEAAARTITKPSPSRLEQLVKKIVQGKLEDGQLNESNLTLNDLERIIKSFAQVLTGWYHSRIEYPPVAPLRSLVPHGHTNK